MSKQKNKDRMHNRITERMDVRKQNVEILLEKINEYMGHEKWFKAQSCALEVVNILEVLREDAKTVKSLKEML